MASRRDGAAGLTIAPAMERILRRSLLRFATGELEIRLTSAVPSPGDLRRKFARIDALGIYLHIPFCERICPYCPYNKELYRSDLAAAYVEAVKKEIDLYAGIVGDRPVTSFYIGGGTPTTMLHSGLADIIEHARRTFDALPLGQCGRVGEMNKLGLDGVFAGRGVESPAGERDSGSRRQTGGQKPAAVYFGRIHVVHGFDEVGV